MKAVISLIALVASTAVVAAEFNSNAGISPVRARLHVSKARARREVKGKIFKRCKPKTQTTSSAAPAPTEAPSPTYSSPAAAATTTTPASTGGNSGGVINVKTSGCGAIGAVVKTTKDAGPNGSLAWLNCGVEGSGWNPPMVKLGDLMAKSLDDEFANPNTIFKACKPYRDYIYASSSKYSIPAIMIASTMMQESSCNKDTVGGGGEQGLMQITKEKCVGALANDCKNPSLNIDAGSKYMADQINSNDGNVLKAVGTYNGWVEKMTVAKATAARYSSCCLCQNNLDYLHQYFNGWMQGVDAYDNNLGVYHNLDDCPGR